MFENETPISEETTAFILCAGKGLRLRPVTGVRPKPLLPVSGGISLLESIISFLSAAGIVNFAVNTFHLANKFEEFANTRGKFTGNGRDSTGNWLLNFTNSPVRLTIVREEKLLGTGGGIGNLYSTVKPKGPVLIHNGDVSCRFDVKKLFNIHVQTGNRLVTMLLTPGGPAPLVRATSDGLVLSIGGGETGEGQLFTYTGIAVMEPDFLMKLPVSGFSSLIPFLVQSVSDNPGSIGWVGVESGEWQDIGTPENYIDFIFGSRNGIFTENGSIEDDTGVTARKVVLLDGAVLRKNDFYYKGLVAPECSLEPGQFSDMEEAPLSEDDISRMERITAPKNFFGKGWTSKYRIRKIQGGGSSRIFYRLEPDSSDGPGYILMDCSHAPLILEKYVAVYKMMMESNLNPPVLYKFSPEDGSAVIEDLGVPMKFSHLRYCTSVDESIDIYKPVIEYLVRFHLGMNDSASIQPPNPVLEKSFDYSTFRWESSYFLEYFVRKYCGIILRDRMTRKLASELDHLAYKLAALPRLWCHRDFQSTNIFITDSQGIKVIDFQDGRIGPPQYDLASLLKDAYFRLSPDADKILLYHYLDVIGKDFNGLDLDPELFARGYQMASLSRVMQALGAFAKLTLVDRKLKFQAHIPRGLTKLRGLLDGQKDMPILGALVSDIDPTWRLSGNSQPVNGI